MGRTFLTAQNIRGAGGPIGIRPDPVPGVGINFTADQFVQAAAGLATVASVVNPYSIVLNYAVSFGFASLASLLAGEQQRLVYLDSDLQFDKERPSRRIFGNPRSVGGWLLGAFTRDRFYRPRFSLSEEIKEDLLPHMPNLAGARGADGYLLLDQVIWLAEGKMTGLDGIWINGEFYELEEVKNVQLPINNRGNTQVAPSNQRFYMPKYWRGRRYGDRFYVTENFGVDQTNAEFARRYPNEWRQAYKAENHSWLTVTFIDLDDVVFRRTPDVRFSPKGQAVTNLVSPGSADVYTDNGASIEIWNWINNVEGIDASKVDVRSFQDAYMWCRQTRENDYQVYQRLSTNRPLPVQATDDYERYPERTKIGAFHGVIESATPMTEFIRRFDIIRGSGNVFVDFGKIKVTVGKNLEYADAVRITNADLAGQVVIRAQPSETIQFNTVRATLVRSQPDGYERSELEITDPVLLAKDGGVKRIRDLGEIEWITDKMQVVRLLNRELRTMRNAQVYEIPVHPRSDFLSLRHNDPVLLTDETNNLHNVPLRVILPQIFTDTARMQIEARYSPPTEKANVLYLPDPNERRFNETVALPPSSITITSEIVQTPQLDIAESTISYVVDRFYPSTEMQYRKSNESVWFNHTFYNTRGTRQVHKFDLFQEDIDYVVQLRNYSRTGEVSVWSEEIEHNPSHDTTKPPIPTGLSAHGIVQGFYVRRSLPVDLDIVPDYSHSEVTAVYTPTGGTEKTVKSRFTGTDHSTVLFDIGRDEKISISLSVVDVDRSRNKSDPVVFTVTTESISEITGLFENFTGSRFVYDNYRQVIPLESPADLWDKSSWYFLDNPPPSTPTGAGVPLTRDGFENFGRAGQGHDSLFIFPVDDGDMSFTDFAESNSNKDTTGSNVIFRFSRFSNTLVKLSLNENYWGILKIGTLDYLSGGNIDGDITHLFFTGVWLHTHFNTPYPTFSADAGRPTLTMDFQLARGSAGEPGESKETLYKLLKADDALPAKPSNDRLYKTIPDPDDGLRNVRPSITPSEPRLVAIDREIEGTPEVGADIKAPWGEWYTVEEFGKDSKNIEFAFARNTRKIAPVAANPENRKIDGLLPTGSQVFTKTPQGVSLNNPDRLFYEYYYIRRKTEGNEFEREWDDWSVGALFHEVDVPIQEFYTISPRGFEDVEWRLWGDYSRSGGVENVDNSQVSTEWLRRRMPPAPGTQYANSPVVPNWWVSGAVSVDTPAETIEQNSLLFRLRVRFRQSASDDWVGGEDGQVVGSWVFGSPSSEFITFIETELNVHWEVVCVIRRWVPELGRFDSFLLPSYCGIVDEGSYLPSGGKVGDSLFLTSEGPIWRRMSLDDMPWLRQWLTFSAYSLTILELGETSIRLRVVVAGSSSSGQYQVRYREYDEDDPEGTTETGWTTEDAQTSSEFTLSPLSATTAYQIQCRRGTGGWSRVFIYSTIQTPRTVAPVISGAFRVKTGTIGSDGFVVEWPDVTVEGEYQGWRVLLDNVSQGFVTTTEYSFLGRLEANTQYQVSLQAENNNVPSNQFVLTQATSAATGTAPSWADDAVLTVDDSSRYGEVSVSWHSYFVLNGGRNVYYEYEWYEDGNPLLPTEWPTSPEYGPFSDHTTFTRISFPFNTRIYGKVRVRAVNAFGRSGWLEGEIRAPAHVGVPTWDSNEIDVLSVLSNSIRFRWPSATGADSYWLTKSTDGSFDTETETEYTGDDNVRAYTYHGLTADTQHYIRIRAKNTAGFGPALVFSRKTEKGQRLAPVWDDVDPEITLWGESIQGFVASWPSAENATGYHYQVSTDENFNTIIRDETIVGTEEVFTTLDANTQFWFRVRADNAGLYNRFLPAQSTWTLRRTVRPSWVTMPKITPTNITSDSFDISWSRAIGSGNIRYRIVRATNAELTQNVFRTIQSGRVSNFTRLDPDTSYYIKITATNGTSDSIVSLTKTVRTLPVYTEAPTWPDGSGVDLTNYPPVPGNALRSMYLDWPDAISTKAIKYYYSYSSDPEFTGATEHETTLTAERIDGLRAGTTYYVRVYPANEDGRGLPLKNSLGTFIAQVPPPSAVTSLRLSVENTINIRARWSAVVGANFGYVVHLSESSDFSGTLIIKNEISQATTETLFEGLGEGTTYYGRIYARNGGGRSSVYPVPPSFVSTTTGRVAVSPNRPVWGTATIHAPSDADVTVDSIKFSWDAPQHATANTRYVAYIRESEITRNDLGILWARFPARNLTGRTHTFTNLKKNTDYWVAVSASTHLAGGTQNPKFIVRQITTDDVSAQAPDWGDATLRFPTGSLKHNEFKFEWDALTATPAVTKYRWQVSTDEDFGDKTDADWTETNRLRVLYNTGVSDSTTYYARVQAYNGNWSESLEGSVTTLGTPISAPSWGESPDVSLGDAQPTSLLLSWSAATGATYYSYDISTKTSFDPNFTTTYEIRDPNEIRERQHRITGLNQGTSYFVRMTAKNDGGGPFPEYPVDPNYVVGTTTKLVETLPAPTISGELGLTTGTNPLSVSLDWSGATVTGTVENYEVLLLKPPITRLTSDELSGWATVVSSDTRTLTFTDDSHDGALSVNTLYFGMVRPVNSDGKSQEWLIKSITTPHTKPAWPANPGPKITVLNSDGFTVSWKAATRNPEQYRVAVYQKSPFRLVKHAIVDPPLLSVDIDGLEEKTDYHVIVVATNDGGASRHIQIDTRTEADPTVAPVMSGGITLKPGFEKVNVAWSAATGVVWKYEVQSTPVKNPPLPVGERWGSYDYVEVDGTDESDNPVTDVDITRLKGDTAYWFRVRAYNGPADARNYSGYVPSDAGESATADSEE